MRELWPQHVLEPSNGYVHYRYNDDEGEVDESEHPYQRLSRVDRRHNPDWYGRQIEKLGRAGKVTEWPLCVKFAIGRLAYDIVCIASAFFL